MSAVRAETLDASGPARRRETGVRARRRETGVRTRSGSTPRAVAPSPRAARSSARPLPQESAGPRALPAGRWRALVTGCAVAALSVGGLCVFIQGERIAAQEEADALSAELDRVHARQRELIVELTRAEMPDEMLERAAVAGMVEPGPVAAVPSAPITPVPGGVPGVG